ncbi:MAG TPA: LuxR C-terminal-related transcriptional regulator [Burkholderiaceae bacterium]|nr:LuxR C-terminal-related transcriptional regulator [Burkholderiaceae bacterium]
MPRIVVVEPDDKLCLTIQASLQGLSATVESVQASYAQLFQYPDRTKSIDLLLLAAPDKKAQLIDLFTAARQHYAIKHSILLLDAAEPPYPLANVCDTLRGTLYKYAAPDIMVAAVSLVLAGGSCFASSQIAAGIGTPNGPSLSNHPGRRWYDNKNDSDGATANVESGKTPSSMQQPDHLSRKDDSAAAPAGLTPAADTFSRQRATAVSATLSPSDAQWPIAPTIQRHELRLLNLTPRQYEVLALLARGYPLKQVSRVLDISLATCKTHTAAIYQRLAVGNRHEAVYLAFSRGATLGLYQSP